MLQPGSTLRRGYTIQRVIGQGGMGTVYLARHTKLKAKRVAIKEMVARIDDPQALAMAVAQFEKEAEILSSIDHPGIVDVKDYFEEDGIHYLVEDFVHGVTLATVIEQVPHLLPIYEVLDWMDQLCDVLEYLHTYNPPIIVRDLKPDNIMLDAKGKIHLIDFGIARVFDPGTKTESILKGTGTIGYAPVEQYGGGTTDTRSDIYSLGATLYACLATRVPPWSVDIATGEEELTPPSAYNPYISMDLENVILKLMAIRKDDRYQSASEARKALADARKTVDNGPAITVVVSQRFCTSCGATTVPHADACPSCNEAYEEVVAGVPVRFPEIDLRSGLPKEAAAAPAEPARAPVAGTPSSMAAAAARALNTPTDDGSARSMAAAAAAALSEEPSQDQQSSRAMAAAAAAAMSEAPLQPQPDARALASAAAAAMAAEPASEPPPVVEQEEEEDDEVEVKVEEAVKVAVTIQPVLKKPALEEELAAVATIQTQTKSSPDQFLGLKEKSPPIALYIGAGVLLFGFLAWVSGGIGGGTPHPIHTGVAFPSPPPPVVVTPATTTPSAAPTDSPAVVVVASPGASGSPSAAPTASATGVPQASPSGVASGSPTAAVSGSPLPGGSPSAATPSGSPAIVEVARSVMDDTDTALAVLRTRKLTEEDLKGLDEHEVGILHNRIYAFHGKKFPQQEVQDYFMSRTWYRQNPDEVSSAMLNDIEKYNLEFLENYQKEHNFKPW